MKRALAILALVAVWPGSLGAQDSVVVSRQDCARLVRHAPAADVAYKPGVDAKGKAVKPADLEDSAPITLKLPEQFEFDPALKPIKNLPKLADTDMKVGKIKYNIMSGELTFNDQPLTSKQAAELAALCQKQGIK